MLKLEGYDGPPRHIISILELKNKRCIEVEGIKQMSEGGNFCQNYSSSRVMAAVTPHLEIFDSIV